MTYTPKYKPNQLILGTGHPIIVTGWTPKGIIARRLDPGDYAAIGSLYSPTRGLSPLIRNLSLNPHIYKILILEATREDHKAGGCSALWEFFNKGVKQEGDRWIINAPLPVPGVIDGEIPEDRLNEIRRNVSAELFDNVAALIVRAKELTTQEES